MSNPSNLEDKDLHEALCALAWVVEGKTNNYPTEYFDPSLEIEDVYKDEIADIEKAILSQYISKADVLEAIGRNEWDEENIRENPIAEVLARNELRAQIKKELNL